MAHHAPAELDRLELLLFGAQLSRLMLEPPRRVHEAGVGRVHQTESGVVGRAGERQHDRRHRRGRIGKDRHAGRLSWYGRFVRGREVDPHQALSLDAGIGAAANLAEIHLLAIPQRGNLDAGAAHVEPPAVIAARDRLTVEAAIMQRDAAVRADVAQRKDAPVVTAADEQRLTEQRLGYEPTRTHVRTHERDIPQTPQKLGLEIVHGYVPGAVPVSYVGMNGRSVSPGLPPACVSMQCTW